MLRVDLTLINADFLWAETTDRRFDAVCFFESFHHCWEFERLLRALHRVLLPGGKVYFGAEPINRDFTVPWGVRLDGESLFVARKWGWMELGFHSDFFEEIAKYRAARRIWYKTMTERFGAKLARSSALRFHAQTAGCSLTAQQPYNNVVRTAVQALAAVMGGAQSLHTNSLDEAWALPTEFAATLALRTQQILAHETGVANTVDPLGGSYFVETLTNEMEDAAWKYIRKIDGMGGMIAAIERGYPQREIADASYRYQVSVDRKEKIIVGVNEFTGEEKPIEILRIDESVRTQQTKQLRKLRSERSSEEVARQLTTLRKAAQGTENLMPHIYDAVKAYATLGEICDSLRDVFGTHEEASIT